jgi:hypothetical protein
VTPAVNQMRRTRSRNVIQTTSPCATDASGRRPGTGSPRHSLA